MSGITGCMDKNLSTAMRDNALNILRPEVDKIMRDQKIPNYDDAFTKALNKMNEVVAEQVNLKKTVEKANDSRITMEFDNFEKTRQAVIKAAEHEGTEAPNYTLYDYMLSRLSINPLGRGNVKGYETIREGYLGGIQVEAPKFMQSLIELTNKKDDAVNYISRVMDGSDDGFNELRRYIGKIANRLDGIDDVNKDGFLKGLDNLQNHNSTHIAGMTRGDFNKLVTENVDKKWLDEMRQKAEKTESGVNSESRLTDLIYDTIVSGKLENNLSLRRELMSMKFKDAEGWYEYHNRTSGTGRVDMQSMGMNYMRNAISEITLMSEFGNDPANVS